MFYYYKNLVMKYVECLKQTDKLFHVWTIRDKDHIRFITFTVFSEVFIFNLNQTNKIINCDWIRTSHKWK